MLSIEQILLIQRLLEAGEHSQREIAEIAKVGRSSVYNVSRGKIAHLRPRRSKPLIKKSRCPHCGGMTTGPCLLCRARTHRQVARISDQTPNGPNPRRAA